MNAPHRTIPKVNPATGALIRDYPVTDGETIRQVVETARRLQSGWAQTDLTTRVRILARAADRLHREADAVAAIIAEEVGKPLVDALEADIAGSLGLLRYYAAIGPRRLKPRRLAPDAVSRLLLRRHRETWHPRGVIAIIAPWNYPVAIPLGGIATALMAGNAVVLKPSEHSPACGLRVAALFRDTLTELGLPSDLVQVILGDGETGHALLQESIDGVIFTGSADVGRNIRRLTAERGLWSSLELGGSDAMLILDDADPEWAASYAIWGRFSNAGQACASIKRLFIPKTLEPELLRHLREKTAQLRVGPPDDPASHLGPLISATQRERLDAQVRDALERGATCLAGGHSMDGPGWFYQPTLLDNVPPDARILREEAFGPALPILIYGDIEEAIARINDSPFGLTVSILGNAGRARALAGRFTCGTVMINEAAATNFITPCAPWGGWKDSGHGVSHGERALTDLCRLQIVSENGLACVPGFEKPPWQFARVPSGLMDRAQTLLTLCNGLFRQWEFLTPVKALRALWRHRAETKI
jgi:succinate-semialdehyde dehydrogenase/glutarate-semialdehyde dehydrogenase